MVRNVVEAESHQCAIRTGARSVRTHPKIFHQGSGGEGHTQSGDQREAEEAVQAARAAVEAETVEAVYCHGFQDHRLNQLVELTLGNTHDRRLATAWRREAQALRSETTFDRYPTRPAPPRRPPEMTDSLDNTCRPTAVVDPSDAPRHGIVGPACAHGWRDANAEYQGSRAAAGLDRAGSGPRGAG